MKGFDALKNPFIGFIIGTLALILIATSASAASGVVFRVDIGTFKTKIQKDRLLGYNYIITEHKNGEFTYHVGKYTDYIHAQRARNTLYEKGFPSSGLVAYFHKRLITMDDAFVLMDNQNQADYEAYSAPQTISVDELNRLLDKNDLRTKDNYVVQVGAFSNKKHENYFAEMPFKVVEYQTSGGTYKYTSEPFATRAEADAAKEKAKRNGVPDAFVVKQAKEAGTASKR